MNENFAADSPARPVTKVTSVFRSLAPLVTRGLGEAIAREFVRLRL